MTGQMQVGLDFHPEKPAIFTEYRADTKTPEIPTIPTPMQELAKKIQNLPIDRIFEKLASALDGIDKLVKSPEITETVHSINQAAKEIKPLLSNLEETVKDMRKLVQNADAKVTGLASNLDETVKEVRGVVRNVDNRIGPLGASIEGTIKSVEATEDRHPRGSK